MAFALDLLWQAWAPISILIVFISLAILTIIYMLGKALGSDSASSWARAEVYHVLTSAALIGLTISLLLIINSVLLLLLSQAGFSCSADSCTFTESRFNSSVYSNSFSNVVTSSSNCGGNGEPCHIAIARSRLDGLFDLVRYWVADNIVVYGRAVLLSSINIGYSTFAIKPFAVAEYIKETYDIIFEITTIMLLLVKSQSIFLTVIEKALFPLFLVGGIALRSISLMRKLGGLLVALAIGLYFFYPMMVIFSSMVISPNPESAPIVFHDLTFFLAESQLSEPISSETASAVSSFDIDIGIGSSATTFSGASPEPQGLSKEATAAYMRELTSNVNVGDQTLSSMSYFLFDLVKPGGFIDNVAFLSVWILAINVIVVYAVLSFIKEFSPLFGGDADIAGLAKLV